MTGKIFRDIMLAVCGVLLASMMIIMGCLYDYFGSMQKTQLWTELDMAAAGVETSGMEYFDAVSSGSRLTWIAADGSVLYDVQADRDAMENHADREEVVQAMESGTGESLRYSDTLLEKTVYCARRLSDGSVLRISVSRGTMVTVVLGMLQPICVVLIVAFVLSFCLAGSLSRRIVEPLNSLDLDHPLANKTYDELAPLLHRINRQNVQINMQLQQLRQKQDEFEQITASMNDGLVMLDDKGCILSVNRAAKKLFCEEDFVTGKNFFDGERNESIKKAVSAATEDGHSEACFERDGRNYQIDISRIESENKIIGVVLLVLDVTEKVEAERTRREFSANVSHELKTPLAAILGSSELLESGMVKSEDEPRFIKHIHEEAARLLTLVEDIIRLSRLDEGVELPTEAVDLAAVANEAAQQLMAKAAACEVTLTLQTEPCILQGVPRLLHEIVYNLTENAIKYNRRQGSVTVSVSKSGTLTVSDTGIGISAEHRARVFERFYRVDKSHSREIGGTGLGLSIVKHACAYLGAAVELQSEVDKGTTVVVRFPHNSQVKRSAHQ